MKSYKKHKHQVIEYNFQTKKYNKFVKKYKYMSQKHFEKRNIQENQELLFLSKKIRNLANLLKFN